MVACIFALFLIAFTTEAKSISGRIIGGRDTDNVYPYQVSLRVYGNHVCGGSLLNHQWILTAAHCLVKYKRESLIIVLGTNNLLSGGVAYRAEKIIVHPDYNRTLRIADIGLIKINEYVVYGNLIAPVNLPMKDVDETNCTAIFTGWGNTELAGGQVVELQEIELKILSLSECRLTSSKIRPTHVCTLTVVGEGLCYGDSGSPLVTNDVQIGIGSWGRPCALGYPDVYTRVYSYTDWIKSNIG